MEEQKEKWARLFHDIYETLAPAYGYETREDTKEFDPDSKNGKFMIAECNFVIDQAIEARDKKILEMIKKKILEMIKKKIDDIYSKPEKTEEDVLQAHAFEEIIEDLTNTKA